MHFYKIVAAVSFIIRQFYLPNPFENMKNGIVYNFIAEPIIHMITYGVVGMFYDAGSNPVLGSFLYLLFYSINTALLMLMGYFEWNKIIIIAIVVIYFIILALICHHKYTD